MREGARTMTTLGILVLVLLVGATWGWAAVTKPFPGKADLPTCAYRTVNAGDKVYPGQVVVSVFNAGTREGLAGRTMALFTDGGFAAGDSGNAPHGTKVDTAQIWTTTPTSPAVLLVKSRLPGVEVVRRDTAGAGVVVMVGDGFTKLAKGKAKVTAGSSATICSPPVR